MRGRSDETHHRGREDWRNSCTHRDSIKTRCLLLWLALPRHAAKSKGRGRRRPELDPRGVGVTMTSSIWAPRPWPPHAPGRRTPPCPPHSAMLRSSSTERKESEAPRSGVGRQQTKLHHTRTRTMLRGGVGQLNPKSVVSYMSLIWAGLGSELGQMCTIVGP